MDILTPLGRGMNFLIVGPRASGKTCVGIDAILAQKSTGEAVAGPGACQHASVQLLPQRHVQSQVVAPELPLLHMPR